MAGERAGHSVGIRELRSDLAAAVRKAAAGEPTVISVNGAPIAQLTSVAEGAPRADVAAAALFAAGALIPPRRSDGRVAEGSVAVWGTVRLDRLLREVRG